MHEKLDKKYENLTHICIDGDGAIRYDLQSCRAFQIEMSEYRYIESIGTIIDKFEYGRIHPKFLYYRTNTTHI